MKQAGLRLLINDITLKENQACPEGRRAILADAYDRVGADVTLPFVYQLAAVVEAVVQGKQVKLRTRPNAGDLLRECDDDLSAAIRKELKATKKEDAASAAQVQQAVPQAFHDLSPATFFEEIEKDPESLRETLTSFVDSLDVDGLEFGPEARVQDLIEAPVWKPMMIADFMARKSTAVGSRDRFISAGIEFAEFLVTDDEAMRKHVEVLRTVVAHGAEPRFYEDWKEHSLVRIGS